MKYTPLSPYFLVFPMGMIYIQMVFMTPQAEKLNISSSYYHADPVEVSNQDNNGFKSDKELVKYFSRYDRNTNRVANYELYYKDLIKSASLVFDIQPAFFSCLIFQESRYDPEAVSPVGASGLGQLMPIAIRHLSHLVKKDIDQVDFNIMFDKINKSSKIQQQTSEINLEAEYVLRNKKRIKRKHKKKNLYNNWVSYLEYTKDHDLSGLEMEYDYINQSVSFNPRVNIGLSAALLTDIQSVIKFLLKKKNLKGIYSPQELMLLTAGLYNQGYRIFFRELNRSSKTVNFSNLIDKVAAVPETYSYINSISRCMEKGNFKKPVRIQHKI